MVSPGAAVLWTVASELKGDRAEPFPPDGAPP